MNVMNGNNIDNRLQTKRENTSKSFKMGEEKKIVIKLRTTEEDKEATGKTLVDVMKPLTESSSEMDVKKTKRKRKSPLIPWKKPEGMPKRPLSAYNLFFQDRRKSITLAASESNENLNEESKSHRKSSKKRSGVGFANLARTIGTEWRALKPEKKSPYNLLAAEDKDRYDREMKVWRAKEKEVKSMRESDNTKNATFDLLPPFTSIGGTNKGLGEDGLSIQNSATDNPLPFTDMMGGMGTGDQSVDVLSLQDHGSRGVFNSSIFNNFNSNMLDTSSDRPSNMKAQRRQQDVNPFSATPFKTSVDLQYNLGRVVTAGGVPTTQYQNQPFGNINNNSPKKMPWNNNRNTLNMDSMMTSSIDLEPLPLPDNHQQHQQQKLLQKTRDSQLGWSGQHGLQQLHAKSQLQQRTTIASNNQYLQRLSIGGASLFPAGWGQNNMNDPVMVSLGDRNVRSVSVGAANMSQDPPSANAMSQEMGNNPMENAKSRNSDNQSFPSSSNNSNQDPWKPLGFFNNEEQN